MKTSRRIRGLIDYMEECCDSDGFVRFHPDEVTAVIKDLEVIKNEVDALEYRAKEKP